jgi:fucose permease
MEQQTASTSSASAFVRDQATWLAYTMLALMAYMQSSLGPVMPFLRAELDMNYTLGGAHTSAFAVGLATTGMIGGLLLRWPGRAAMLWGGGVGMSLGAIMLALSPHVAFTLGSVLVMGFLAACTLITVNAVLVDRHGSRSAVALVEANMAASLAATTVPLIIGGLQYTPVGWRGALFLPLLLVVLLALLLWRAPLPAAPVPTSPETKHHHARLPLAFWLAWIVIFLGVSIEWTLIIWSADFFETVVGLARRDAATLVSVFLGAMLVGRFAGSRLAHSITTPTLLLASVLLMLVGFPLFWLAPTVLLNIVGLAVAGLGVANMFPLGTALALGSAPGQTDIASVRASLAGSTAVLSAPFTLGWAADQFNIHAAFGIVAVWTVLALIMVLLARAARSRSKSTSAQVEPL